MRSLWDDVGAYLPEVLEDWRRIVGEIWPRRREG
jgi:hypothetical protein